MARHDSTDLKQKEQARKRTCPMETRAVVPWGLPYAWRIPVCNRTQSRTTIIKEDKRSNTRTKVEEKDLSLLFRNRMFDHRVEVLTLCSIDE